MIILCSVFFIKQSLHKDSFCSGFVFYLTTGHSIPLVRYERFRVLRYYCSNFSSLYLLSWYGWPQL